MMVITLEERRVCVSVSVFKRGRGKNEFSIFVMSPVNSGGKCVWCGVCVWLNPCQVFVLGVGCMFDHSLEEVFLPTPLSDAVSEPGHECRVFVFLFGSQHNVHWLVVQGLKMTGMLKSFSVCKMLVCVCRPADTPSRGKSPYSQSHLINLLPLI